MEQRLLLSAAVQNVLPTAPLRPLLDHIYDQIEAVIPDEFKEVAMPILNLAMQSGRAGYSYLAFPGEVNDVKVWGELGNSLLLTNESTDVTIFRLGTLSFDPIEEISFEPDVKIEGGGSFVGHIAGGLGLTLDGVITSVLKGWFDLSEPRVVSLNGMTLLNLLPTANDVLNAFDYFLNFSLSDLIPNDITIIPPIRIFGKKVWDGWSVPVPSFLQNIPTVGDLLDWSLPGPVRDVFDMVTDVTEWLQSTFFTDGVYLSLLDGPDKVDLSQLTGIPQTVFAGSGNDIILGGGGQDLLDSWGVPFRGDRASREVELYGEQGNDTFIVNRYYDSTNTTIDGGSGNDVLLIEGSDASDIIRLIAGADGKLDEIRFEIPNPQAGTPSNEIQRLTMPSDVNGGTFRLKAEGWGWTNNLPWNATASAIELELARIATNADPVLGIDDIDVTGGNRSWDIEFLKDLARTNFAPLVVDGSALQRSVTAAVVTTERDGGDGGGQPIANEMQEIKLPDNVTGGTFTLQFDTYPETGPISAQAGVGDLELALLRTGMSRQDFEVTGPYAGPWRIEFTGGLALTDVSTIVVDGSDLWGGMDNWDLPRLQQGVEQINRVEFIDIPDEADGGTFRVIVTAGSQSRSTNVPYNATAVELENAIADLGTVGDDNVNVTRQPDGRFRVEFIEDLAGDSQVVMTVDGSELKGLKITEEHEGDDDDNEFQIIELTSGAAGGQFTLSFEGESTGALSTSASATDVEAALEALSTIGADNVSVTGPAGGPWEVEFVGDLEETNVELLDGELLVHTTVQTPGADGVNEVQSLVIPPTVTGGHLQLIVRTPDGGAAATIVPYDTDAQELQDILEDLSIVGQGNVQVSGAAGNFAITFIEELGAQPIEPITVDTRFLAGGANVTVKEFSPLTVNEIQKVQVPYQNVATGTFQLELPGHGTTGAIDFDASVDDVTAVLEAAFGTGSVEVRGEPGEWEIEFTGSLGAQNLAEMNVVGGVANVHGAEIEVEELTGGSDGENTTVLTTTKFTELENVELFQIAGGGGNDTLIVDNSLGAIHFNDGIHFSGDDGINRVVFTGDGTTRATASEHEGDQSTMTFGAGPEDVQLLLHSSSDIYDLGPADAMTLNGTGEGDEFHFESAEFEGETVGLIHASGGPSSLHFSNKDELIVNMGGGDDVLTLNLGDLPAGLLTVTLDGQGSTGGDQVLINGTDRDDVFDFTPTSMKGGTMAVNAGGVDIAVELVGIESLAVDAMAHDAIADTLAVNAPKATLEPGAYPGTGRVLPRSAAGLPRLAVSYVDVEDVDVRVLDVLAVEGTGGDDTVRVTPSQVIFTDLFGDDNVTDIAGAAVVFLHLMDGNDVITVDATTALPFQLELLGGGSDPGGDALIFAGTGGDLTLNLDDRSLTDANGSPLTFFGVEAFDLDTAGGGMAVVAASDDETLEVTPLDNDAGRLALVGSPLAIDYSGLAGRALAVDLAAGQDVLVVNGSPAGDTISAEPGSVVFTDDGRSLTYTGTEALSILGLQGNDRLDLDNSAGLILLPGGLYFDGGAGEDLLRLAGTTAVDAGTYKADGTIIHTIGADQQFVAFDNLESVIDIVPGPLTVEGTGSSNIINLDVGPNTGSDLVGGLDSERVSVDDLNALEFAGKTSLRINGLAGHDTIDLNDASLPAELTSVTLDGGSGNDILIGSAEHDQLIGGRGDDLLRGEGGDDVLSGGEGQDTLLGGIGDDVLDGGTDADDLDGGAGNDLGIFTGTDGNDTASVAAGVVTINGVTDTYANVETVALGTLDGEDRVSVDAAEGFPPVLEVTTGEGDDHIDVLLANPAPATSITVDGGPHDYGDSAIVTGATGDNQFTTYGMLNVFGNAVVSLVDIEDATVLEGTRIDNDRTTVENSRFVFGDADGNLTMVRIARKGTVDVFRNIFNGRNSDIYLIDLVDTSEAQTEVGVNVRRAPGTDNETSVGAVTGGGARKIFAPRSDLVGKGINVTEGIRSLVWDDIPDGTVLSLGGESGQYMSLQADHVGNVDLTTGRRIGELKVSSWANGTIQGSILDRITATQGPFGADLVNTRRTKTEYGVRQVTVKGNLTTNILADRVGPIRVTDGDAIVNVTVLSDSATLRGKSAASGVSVRGGDLLGANFLVQEDTLVERIDVGRRRGTGGNVYGTVNVTGNLGNSTVAGNLVIDAWNVLGSMGNLAVKGVARAAGEALASVRAGFNMGALRLGTVRHLDFLAGIDPTVARNAEIEDDFVEPAKIKSITIRGTKAPKGEPTPRSVVNSNFSAASMGAVKIWNADLPSTGLHVLSADGDELTSVRHRDTDDPTLNITYPAKRGEVFSQPFDLINIID